MRPEEERISRERQGTRTDIVEIFHNVEKPKTRDRIANFFGVSVRTLEKARAVVEAARQDPEKYQPLLEEMGEKGRMTRAVDTTTPSR
jgi:hypothetical protein